MTDFQALGQQFCDFYYKTFDSDRSQLVSLYREHSMLTFENSQTQGHQAIVTKLQELPFKKVAHRVSTLDAQPSSPSGGGVLVMVTGELMIDDEQNAQRYSQVFHLLPEGGSFYVLNDIFRLNWG
ncbi:Nuclear transport factor 2 [Taphrina deformans PYCC 5710]|uniref:Nuclear transport factor 2 n=1 Tax=Taphrina deformans (strain PYCC 5710 / ATCC 11124 / CBS 356.35 / IMI 108563 / JCM 9778 / NBRC 8474) TaxID=1097556 RepID=R4XCZ7_TAPDE|nr:Nuclear transport factor 2 [Taphrina deformans PYCC 5710]|eukprot:CCG82283.1 Nuclear transport factor 2 [Taphrina deformans PYCC 5710]